MNLYIFDCEVFRYDWFFVFKNIENGEFTVIHNDNTAVKNFLTSDKILAGFNNKYYDNYILKAVLCDADNALIKELNDFIIGGRNAWEHWFIKENRAYFDSFDLRNDMQEGLSLKAIEAHLGMAIEESSVDFNIDRALTPQEVEETVFYCKYDVTATEKLYHLRKNYLQNKTFLGGLKGIPDEKALYMTNAKLTAAYLDASPISFNDERNYKFPDNLRKEYLTKEVIEFFEKLFDETFSDEEVFLGKYNFNIGDCKCTLGYGGIHGAIPTYQEKATEHRSIRNRDVASYYPHLMTLDGYCSRAIPDPSAYSEMLENRMQAKRNGDKQTANALKLVCNTTYGAMLNKYNDLFDPLMGRSVCITGQLRLLELTLHLVTECKSLKVVQLNTDGIMVSIDNEDLDLYNNICHEWEQRTGFELEEDCISEIVQKDVNNYIEISVDGKTKIKGGVVVRGISDAGAWNINNNATVVAKSVVDYFSKKIPVEKTIEDCNDPLAFQLIAKASSKYTAAYHLVNGEKVKTQKCNRVYATKDHRYGTLVKTHHQTGNDAKIGGLPPHCIIDNKVEASIEDIDKKWYVKLAKGYINDFLGIKPPKVNTRKINSLKKKILKILED